MENITDEPNYYDSNDYYSRFYDIHVPGQIYTLNSVIIAVTFFLGTTGNGLVIWIAGFKMKKTVSVVWFLNLAIADFLFALFMPLNFVGFTVDFYWYFNTFMCKLNNGIIFLNMYLSIFILTVISIDRCVCVVCPVWAQNHRTPAAASMAAIIVWIFAVFFSLSYVIFRQIYRDVGNLYCYSRYHEIFSDLFALRYKVAVITRFIFGLLIPFAVIAVCYRIISSRPRRNRMTKSSRSFKVITAVLISFFFCWSPNNIFSIMDIRRFSRSDSVGMNTGLAISINLAFLNSCINPFLYVLVGQDFKTVFKTPIQTILENAFLEDRM